MSPPNNSSIGDINQSVTRKFLEHKMGVFGVCCLVIIGGLCFLAPFFTHHTYDQQNLAIAGEGPSAEHWLGTDILGRDLFARILYGGRISFLVGISATFVSLTIGVTYGAISGWAGGRIDRLLMRIVEIIYSLPYTVFVILLMVFLGRGLFPLLCAIGAVEWLTMSRIVRGQVLNLRQQSFVEASQILGQKPLKIIWKHMIPNAMTPIIICITLTIPNVMLMESFISFLGLGIQAPMTSWGDLIKEGANAMQTQPWLLIFPSLFFSITLFSLNYIGDALRSALDPHS
ncbi:MAG: peptide ABC transporter permease [Verrucomicrobia bacterium CG_4_10_14_3_um_filter_43_23]|nr:MAG: peptide ABC transporter permease [Verrucomicrobia bacterium CG1_02_43_26]PIP59183.1 MAG: peptide ABC transporter permease [Verrucomicrobia bacterium CG22_combo_CG10-13_8_21_14_all_43_17]PIX58459.1 MAG: peptide ABC transporter permease [Verrucomicrobia bacterium CG_4_10_14_3_um_filter_43_23]PIY63183.1 MAG: peptide ABC transporter permease [Verrucomicrobia bacterium CG_4_10_14_0_8_um_filter_43_34]PJA44902.1 MAG: peptide ABC transporter permease [Verrucomicrobia bacterium CG_4_9_14_3_um_fi